MLDFGFGMVDWQMKNHTSTNPELWVVAKTATGGGAKNFGDHFTCNPSNAGWTSAGGGEKYF
jgi:hypothetical protein